MTDQNVAPVAGYSHQSQQNRDMVNEIKQLEERVLRALDKVQQDVPGTDPRWLSIGRTHIQQGFMAVVRGISNPQRIALPEDGEAKKA